MIQVFPLKYQESYLQIIFKKEIIIHNTNKKDFFKKN